MLLLLILSTILVMFAIGFVYKMKNKTQIHNVFLSNLALILIWNLSVILQIFLQNTKWYTTFYEQIYFICVCILPISLLYTGVVFEKTKIKFTKKHLMIFIIPIISIVLILTNDYHHLFLEKYSLDTDEIAYGSYFAIHTAYSYGAVLVGLLYLIHFSIKNSGFFSKQSILIFAGILIPLLADTLSTFKILDVPTYLTNVSFSLLVFCWMFAIFKFQFLNVIPIALQRVVDLMSDSYIILNENYEIIDYNKTFTDTFANVVAFKRKDSFIDLLKTHSEMDVDYSKFIEITNEAKSQRKTIEIEKHIQSGRFDRHFAIEITPILSNDSLMGYIVLFKDITQHKQDIEVIKQTQKQLTERERLASLGQLAGGVAHDINSPLAAVQAGLYSVNKFIEYVSKQSELSSEIQEMSAETKECMQDINSACQKIAKIVNSVRNHTRNLSGENIQEFYPKDVLEDLKILINHQLKQTNCTLDIIEEERKLIKGDPGKLSQVLTNLIINAVEAYGGKEGTVEARVGLKDNKALISIKDNAGGIPEKFRDGIFKNILTTKGTQGTGMGLYISYSIITGNFGGEMSFESEEGKGTRFCIAIPVSQQSA